MRPALRRPGSLYTLLSRAIYACGMIGVESFDHMCFVTDGTGSLTIATGEFSIVIPHLSFSSSFRYVYIPTRGHGVVQRVALCSVSLRSWRGIELRPT